MPVRLFCQAFLYSKEIWYAWLDVDYFRDYTEIKLRIHGDSRSFF